MDSRLLLGSQEYFAECYDDSCCKAIIRGGRESLGVVIDRLHPNCPARWSLRPGLGDRVAAALDSVGITKARVQAVASAVGIKDCGCKQRQQALNDLGRSIGIG